MYVYIYILYKCMCVCLVVCVCVRIDVCMHAQCRHSHGTKHSVAQKHLQHVWAPHVLCLDDFIFQTSRTKEPIAFRILVPNLALVEALRHTLPKLHVCINLYGLSQKGVCTLV